MAKGGPAGIGTLELLWRWLTATHTPPSRRLFTRSIQISDPALRFIRERCTPADRTRFAELLLRLDSDPITHSRPHLPKNPAAPELPPGLRWAAFGTHRVIIQVGPTMDLVRVLLCE